MDRHRSVQCPAASGSSGSQQAGGTQELPPSSLWSVPLDDPWAALLLAWYAARSNSLLAAQCLVEAALQLYISGTTFTEVSLGLKLASWNRGASPGDPGGVAPLLPDQDESELLSWVALVMLAAQLAGAKPAGSSGPAPQSRLLGQGDGDGERYLAGMRTFVQQALKMWRDGMTLVKLTGLQSAVNTGQGGRSVQSVMQQYTRIVIMALEVMTSEQLIPPAPAPRGPVDDEEGQEEGGSSRGPLSGGTAGGAGAAEGQRDPANGAQELGRAAGVVGGLRPLGYTATFTTQSTLTRQDMPGADVVPASRQLGVRLLVAFMGAVEGFPYAMDQYVETAFVAYTQGVPAASLMAQLTDSDFDASGGLVPVAEPRFSARGQSPGPGAEADGPGGSLAQGGGSEATAAPPGLDEDSAGPPTWALGRAAINRELFGSWLSATYMALAQLGAPMPGALAPGWAWAGPGDPLEALGLDRFVRGVLKAAVQEMIGESQASLDEDNLEPDPDGGVLSQDAATKPAPRVLTPGEEASRRIAAEQQLELLEPFLAHLMRNADALQQLEQVRQAAAQEYLTAGTMRGKELPTLVKVQDDGLAATSPAFRLVAAQTQLVQRVLALALRVQHAAQRAQALQEAAQQPSNP